MVVRPDAPGGRMLKALGYFSDEAVHTRASYALHDSAGDQASQRCTFAALGLQPEFASEHALHSLHLWIVSSRLIVPSDYKRGGKEVREQLFERFWEGTARRIRNLGVRARVCVCVCVCDRCCCRHRVKSIMCRAHRHTSCALDWLDTQRCCSCAPCPPDSH